MTSSWNQTIKKVLCVIYMCSCIGTVIFLKNIFRLRSEIIPTASIANTRVSEPWRGNKYNIEGNVSPTPRVEVPGNKTFIQMSMRQRAAYVRTRCNEQSKWKRFNSLIRSTNIDAVLSNDEYNITLCINRKVASTNIRMVFYMLENSDLIDDVNEIKKGEARNGIELNEIEVDKVKKGRHIKVIFVRDPLERLLSAYRDDRGFEDLRINHKLSFKEFLQAIAMKIQKWENIHMVSYFDACHPCEVDYDYIGLTDTFDRDMGKILHKLDASFVNLPRQNRTGYAVISKEKMAKYLKGVSPRLLEFIYTKYRLDYFMFGFKHPKYWLDDTFRN